jgi:hypothetical protein
VGGLCLELEEPPGNGWLQGVLVAHARCVQWHQALGFMAAVIFLTLILDTSFILVTQQVIAGS